MKINKFLAGRDKQNLRILMFSMDAGRKCLSENYQNLSKFINTYRNKLSSLRLSLQIAKLFMKRALQRSNTTKTFESKMKNCKAGRLWTLLSILQFRESERPAWKTEALVLSSNLFSRLLVRSRLKGATRRFQSLPLHPEDREDEV